MGFGSAAILYGSELKATVGEPKLKQKNLLYSEFSSRRPSNKDPSWVAGASVSDPESGVFWIRIGIPNPDPDL